MAPTYRVFFRSGARVVIDAHCASCAIEAARSPWWLAVARAISGTYDPVVGCEQLEALPSVPAWPYEG